jgi:hypothetical protein
LFVTNRHDCASALPGAAAEPSAREALAQLIAVDEVRERLLAVDLDDGDQDSIARFELRIAFDVDELELEAELATRGLDDLEAALAQSAVGRVVEADRRYG